MPGMNFAILSKREIFFPAFCVAIFIAFCAPIKIHIPGFPVPWILQNSAVVFCALVLPFQVAISGIALFLLGAFAGLPLLPGGDCLFLGPKIGYYIGYFCAPFLLNFCYKEKGYFIGSMLAHALIWFFGWSCLSFFLGMKEAFWCGVAPFVLTDSIKAWLEAKLAKRLKVFLA